MPSLTSKADLEFIFKAQGPTYYQVDTSVWCNLIGVSVKKHYYNSLSYGPNKNHL